MLNFYNFLNKNVLISDMSLLLTQKTTIVSFFTNTFCGEQKVEFQFGHMIIRKINQNFK